MKRYYLAYGSNLNIKEMKNRCPDSKPIGTSFIKNYRLAFKGSCDNFAYLTIEKAPNEITPVGVFEISKKDMHALDIYESYPDLYTKQYLTLEVNNKKIKALIYIINNKDDLSYHLPSKSYLDRCFIGYHDFSLDYNFLLKAINYTNKQQNITKKNKILRLR